MSSSSSSSSAASSAPVPPSSSSEQQQPKKAPHTGVHYADYLHLDTLLSCVKMESEKVAGTPAHEEHLFIVIHQVYELWFKQMLWEIESVTRIFSEPVVDERLMLVVINRLTRVLEIQKILVDQIRVLETMDPLDFMAFRGYLVPASGFQSIQFRKLENLLGLRPENRTTYQQQHYKSYFTKEQVEVLEDSEQVPSLLMLVEKWLERTPGLELGEYKFWDAYCGAVQNMLASQRQTIADRPDMDEFERGAMLAASKKSEELFQGVVDPKVYDEEKEEGKHRISHKAMQGALMIHMYRQEPRFNLPYQMLRLLCEIDNMMIQWRYQHMQMVSKMIGNKVGTGGSAGVGYLRATIGDKYKVFQDINNIPTYLLPRQFSPELPKQLTDSLNYNL